MRIEPKFSVNDLVQHKFQRVQDEKSTVSCYEVIEITSITCSAGTQVFYDLRPIFRIFLSTGWTKENNEKKLIDVSAGAGENNKLFRFREDELKECPIEISEQVKGEKIK